ncbi:MAG TPA: DUF5667 domain-containing protein [Candidatus Paceibacterota bacterium]|nr:DUF5667 domain-containing protein [Candidatus Paceibacterota bacterium]
MKNDFKKLLHPDRDFAAEAKERYLAAFDARHGTRPEAVRRAPHAWAKVLIAAAACAAIMMSVSAYADTANVAADNPLYPLKRLSENVRLALAPQGEQAEIQVSLADRRANEIEDLSVRKPTSTIIAKLSLDLQDAVSSSLGDVQDENGNNDDNGNGNRDGDHTHPVITSALNASGTATGTAVSSATAMATSGASRDAENNTEGNHGRGNVSTSAQGSNSDLHDSHGRAALTVCRGVSALLVHSLHARSDIFGNVQLLSRLEARCGDIANGSTTTAAATSSLNVGATTTATTSIIIVPHGRLIPGLHL